MGDMDWIEELTIAAPPRVVYEAVATEEGVRGWWQELADVAETEGGLSRIVFSEAGWTELRVERLRPERLVEWTCVGQDIANFDPRDEWVGTTISFAMAPEGDGTLLGFAHRGLAGLGCAGLCEEGWTHYLHRSLKPLCESAEGRPSSRRSAVRSA